MSEDALPLKDPEPPLDADALAAVRDAIACQREREGALLPILHAIQEALRHVPQGAVPIIAKALNISRADVHGAISFYHHFRASPPGRHVLRLCRAEACQAVGARALEQHVKRRLGVDFHGTTADGRCTLEPVYCLGNCALAPSLLWDEELHGRVTPAAFDALLADAAART